MQDQIPDIRRFIMKLFIIYIIIIEPITGHLGEMVLGYEKAKWSFITFPYLIFIFIK